MKPILLIAVLCWGVATVADVSLVEDGKPVAEIVVAEEKPPFSMVAARELQKHLEKISGAKLNIVTKPSDDVPNQVYVGEGEFTRKLGFTLDDVKYDGFKIVAEGNHAILAGKDIDVFSTILGEIKTHDRNKRQQEWEKITGKIWRRHCHVPMRDYNEELKMHIQDGTGTLYAVYEALKQLGWRWYLPVADIGYVYPELKNVAIKDQFTKVEPEFPVRIYADLSLGNSANEFLWYKSMKMGSSEFIPAYHSIGRLTAWRQKEMPPEYFGVVDGKINYRSPKMSGKKLRDDFTEFLEFTRKTFPDVNYLCIGQPDGWGVIDDKDVAAGWDKVKERGPRGRFSDYYWDFILDIRDRFEKRNPNLKYSVNAYSGCNRVPTNLKEVPEDVVVVFCQASPHWSSSPVKTQKQDRDDWQKIMPGEKQMYIWDHYLQHGDRFKTPPVPLVFTKDMKLNFDSLYDRSPGGLVELGWTSKKERKRTGLNTARPGLTHLMYLLHGELCWNRNLDIPAFFNDYFEKFFGPAAAEMKAFYEFADEVWSCPGTRTITAKGGWLSKANVNRFFELLAKAKEKAGDTVYRRRIEFIEKEMEPLKLIHEQFKRVGPDLRCRVAKEKNPVIDGNLDKPFWREKGGFFTPLKDMVTGERPEHVETKASFRWLSDNSALVVAVECFEPKMDNIVAGCADRDSPAIWNDDFVEIQVMTPAGISPKIAVNPSGAVYDACVTEDVEQMPLDYTLGEVGVKKYDDRWTVEAKIDAKILSGEQPTQALPWGVNVCRQRMAGNKPENYMLFPSGTNFKDVRAMGNLFVKLRM